jgi:alpha-galactosidase
MENSAIERCYSIDAHSESTTFAAAQIKQSRFWRAAKTLAIMFMVAAALANAQINGVGQRPYLGWSTYSEQTIVASSTVMNEQNILAQSNAMLSSGLGAHGFRYINLDAGWTGNPDGYGRPLWNTTEFPTFLEMIQHIHANGQKIGIYLNPGIGGSSVTANLPHLRHAYHIQDIMVMPLTSR